MKKSYRIGSGMIEVAQGSITAYKADALVCPANGDLEMVAFPGGVQFAFFNDGGEKIFKEAREVGAHYLLEYFRKMQDNVGSVPECSAHITGAGKLPVKHVIHSVAVGMRKEGSSLYCNAEIIRRSTKNALNLARDHKLSSIGFPALGTGLYSVPLEDAVEAMSDEFISHLNEKTPLERIGLVLYSPNQYTVGKNILDRKLR